MDDPRTGYRGTRPYDEVLDTIGADVVDVQMCVDLLLRAMNSKEWWILIPGIEEGTASRCAEIEDKFYGVSGESAWDYKLLSCLIPGEGLAAFFLAHKSRMSAIEIAAVTGIFGDENHSEEQDIFLLGTLSTASAVVLSAIGDKMTAIYPGGHASKSWGAPL